MAKSLQFFEPSEIEKKSEKLSMFVYVLNSFFNYRFCFNLAPFEEEKDAEGENSNLEQNNEENQTKKINKEKSPDLEENLNNPHLDKTNDSQLENEDSRDNDPSINRKISKISGDSFNCSEDDSEKADLVVDLPFIGSRSMSFEKKEVKKNMILKRMSQILETKWNDRSNLEKIVDWGHGWLKEWLKKIMKKANITDDEEIIEKRYSILVFDMSLIEKKMEEEINNDEYTPGFVIVSSKNITAIERVS
jgi:hypothetical protein